MDASGIGSRWSALLPWGYVTGSVEVLLMDGHEEYVGRGRKHLDVNDYCE